MSKDGERLVQFMNGYAAALQLARRAAENGFLIEFIILAAAAIDGALRTGLVLQHQLDTKSSEIPAELYLQRDEDKAISERQIYHRALDKKIISKKLFEDLQDLYTSRNRVVHRYIISDITTEKVFQIGRRLEDVLRKIYDAIWVLEDKQARLGIGMAQKVKPGDEDLKTIEAMAAVKHGAEWLARAFKQKENSGIKS
jgi:hypothetical protein